MSDVEARLKVAYHAILEEMPDPPTFDEIVGTTVAPARGSRMPVSAFAAAAAAVVLLVGGLAVLLSSRDTAVNPAAATTIVDDLVDREPAPLSPVEEVARGEYVGSETTWVMTAWISTEGLCYELSGTHCGGGVTDDSAPRVLQMIASDEGNEQWCGFGAVVGAESVELELASGRIVEAPIYTHPSFDADFFAYCAIGNERPVTARPVAPIVTPSTIFPNPPARIGFDQIWGLAYPSDWYRAESDLMPNLGFRSFTIATMPLRPGGDHCAQVPENALRDMSTTDVLISVFFSGDADNTTTPFPEKFDDSVISPELNEAHLCADRPTLEIHWGEYELEGQRLYLLVAFGETVEEARRSETWATLSSLQLVEEVDSGRSGVCVVTAPTTTVFIPPSSHPSSPPVGEWYGSAELWTVLDPSGLVWHQSHRKDVWWSEQFSLSEGWQPALSVEAHRTDTSGAVYNFGYPGWTSNGMDSAGLWMITDLELPEHGCWTITGEYKDHSLTYIAAFLP